MQPCTVQVIFKGAIKGRENARDRVIRLLSALPSLFHLIDLILRHSSKMGPPSYRDALKGGPQVE